MYAEAADASQKECIRRAILPIIEGHAPIERFELEPYWKVPATYGLTFWLRSGNDLNVVFDGLVALTESGWTFGEESRFGERGAVWNSTAGAVFLTPQVRWANLELWCSVVAQEDGGGG